MLPFQELTKSLPPIPDDEPPSLRQEIADEIADHLQCSLRRELLVNGGDESSARVRVLDKFGDPSQIARQLWYQAMWSKIMSQRVMLIMSSFSIIVSTTLAGLVGWMALRQAHDSAATQQRLAEAAVSIERLVRMIQTPEKSEPARDPNWNHLKLKVTLNRKDGPPAEGYYLYVTRVPRIGESRTNLQGRSVNIGSSGLDDCGFVEAGLYEIQATAPWGEATTFSFTILPGHDHEEHLVVPDEIPKSSPVRLGFDHVPGDMARSEVAVVISITPSGKRKVDDQEWSLPSTQWGLKEVRNAAGVTIQTIANVRASVPAVMYIPGHGFWVSRSGVYRFTFNSGNFQTLFPKITWEPCQLPFEFQVPAHEYSIEYNYVHLLNDVDPTHERWRESCAADMGVDPVAFPAGWGNSAHTEKRVVNADGPNEWQLVFPDTVIKRMKTKVYPAVVEPEPQNQEEMPSLDDDEIKRLKKLLEGQELEKKVLRLLDIDDAQK